MLCVRIVSLRSGLESARGFMVEIRKCLLLPSLFSPPCKVFRVACGRFRRLILAPKVVIERSFASSGTGNGHATNIAIQCAILPPCDPLISTGAGGELLAMPHSSLFAAVTKLFLGHTTHLAALTGVRWGTLVLTGLGCAMFACCVRDALASIFAPWLLCLFFSPC